MDAAMYSDGGSGGGGEKLAAQRRAERRAIARLHRGHDSDEVNFLNITAMMDMMTILLVFMLKSLSTQSTNVVVSDQLSLPLSGTAQEIAESTSVTVTKNAVLVEGYPVADVRNGSVDPSMMEGGGSGLIIQPLFVNLKNQATIHKRAALAKGTPFQGKVTIIADKTTPYRLLAEVLYTAGAAEYRMYQLVVLDKQR